MHHRHGTYTEGIHGRRVVGLLVTRGRLLLSMPSLLAQSGCGKTPKCYGEVGFSISAQAIASKCPRVNTSYSANVGV